MAKYGAKYLQWAPFAAENPDALETAFPKYRGPDFPGGAGQRDGHPTFNEAKMYGDNALKEHVNEFKECGVAVELTDLANSVASAVLGATISEETENDLEFSADNAPYGGLAFYINKMVDGVKSYHGIYYPKLKASMQGTAYTTKGDSITLAGGSLNFTAAARMNGKWKVSPTTSQRRREPRLGWIKNCQSGGGMTPLPFTWRGRSCTCCSTARPL